MRSRPFTIYQSIARYLDDRHIDHTQNILFNKLRRQRFISENILLLLTQIIGFNFGTLNLHGAPLNCASATALAFLFLRGWYVLPGIGLGCLCAFSLAHSGILLAMTFATIYTSSLGLLYYLTSRFISPTLYFVSNREFSQFLLLTSFWVMMQIMPLFYFLDGMLPALMSWGLMSFNGIIISMGIIYLDMFFPELKETMRNKKTISVFLFLLCLTLLLAYQTSWLLIAIIQSAIFFMVLFINFYMSHAGKIAALNTIAITLLFANYLASPIFATSLHLLEIQIYLVCLFLLLYVHKPSTLTA